MALRPDTSRRSAPNRGDQPRFPIARSNNLVLLNISTCYNDSNRMVLRPSTKCRGFASEFLLPIRPHCRLSRDAAQEGHQPTPPVCLPPSPPRRSSHSPEQ